MKKYVKSTRGNLVYEIERQSFTEKFRTPEDYFTRATRNVWYSTTGFNMFVQYKGAFYMIDHTHAHGYITSLEFSPVTAEEAAAAKMECAAQAMSEAQEHEAKTAAAALDYDTETAAAEAREAHFSADYAAILAKDAAELAAEAGTSNAASIADTTAEYAERARRYATSAEETAEQNARELEERAEIIAAIEDDQQRDYIEAEATAHQWSPEETAAEIKYRHDARARKQAEPVTEDETEAAATAAIWHTRPAADLMKYEACKYLEIEPAPRDIYQRYELVAYLGEPDAYDLAAIEAEATETDYATGRIYWRKGIDLAAIAERHELVTYYAI